MYDLILRSTLPEDRNPVLVYLGTLSKSGRRTYHQSLDVIAELLGAPDALSCNWSGLRFQHTALIRTMLIELETKTGELRYKPKTINKILSAMRGVLGAAYDLGQISDVDYHKAIRVKSVKVETLPAGRDLPWHEIDALMKVCKNDPTPAGARDGAIIAILYSCGLRRAELVNMDLEDYEPATGRVVVTGKGNKERSNYILNGGSVAVNDWLQVRGSFPGPLFVPILKGGAIDPRPMSTTSIYMLLRKRGNQAGLKEFSPHDLRRSCVGAHLDAGNDLVVVQKIVGHKNIETTSRYDRRGDVAKRAAAGKFFFPYAGRQEILEG